MQKTLQHYLRIKQFPNLAVYAAVLELEVLDACEHNYNLLVPFGVTATRCCRVLQLPARNSLPVSFPVEPPWKLDISSCRDLYIYTEASTHPTALKKLFLNHLVEEHSDSIQTVQNLNKVLYGPHLALELQSNIDYNLSQVFSRRNCTYVSLPCKLMKEMPIIEVSQQLQILEAAVYILSENQM